MTCRVQATLDLQSADTFVHHDLDFSKPTPLGFALCRACNGFFTVEQWAAWQCTGAKREAAFVPRILGEVPCALCRAGVYIEPMHRAVVEMFGTTCDSCALGVAA